MISVYDCRPVSIAVEEDLEKAKTYTEENEIMMCLNNAKNKSQTITKDALDKGNNFFDSILSGVRGIFPT